jgi:transcriptional regulator with XRE-family HTH domain
MAEVEGYDLEGFGERVRRGRKELGLTQAQLAKRTGVDETAVRRWEDSILPRDADTLVRLAVALDHSVGWVLGENRDIALIDGIRLALDHVRRVAIEDRHRLDFKRDDMLVEMKTGYSPPPTAVRRVAEPELEQREEIDIGPAPKPGTAARPKKKNPEP